MPANRRADTSGDRRSRVTGPHLPRAGAFSATRFEEPVEILALEPEATPVAELRGRNARSRAYRRIVSWCASRYAAGRRSKEPPTGERD